jgi:signal recognition particle subunit SRP54
MGGMGMGKMKGLDDEQTAEAEKKMARMEAMIYSMTPAERKDPSILNASRRKRIAAGCGQPVSKINSLIKKYEDAKKLMKQFNNPNFMKKNKKFRGLF